MIQRTRLACTAFEAATLFGAGSRNPSGPADMMPRQQAGHMIAIDPPVRILIYALASEGPSTQGPKDCALRARARISASTDGDVIPCRHPRESGDPAWVPAFAGMTARFAVRASDDSIIPPRSLSGVPRSGATWWGSGRSLDRTRVDDGRVKGLNAHPRMAGIAQLAERQVVVLDVTGSSPVARPIPLTPRSALPHSVNAAISPMRTAWRGSPAPARRRS